MIKGLIYLLATVSGSVLPIDRVKDKNNATEVIVNGNNSTVVTVNAGNLTERSFLNPMCASCSYIHGKQYKFYDAVLPKDKGGRVETFEEFIHHMGPSWTGHRLCCLGDEPVTSFNVTTYYNTTLLLGSSKVQPTNVPTPNKKKSGLQKRQNNGETLVSYPNILDSTKFVPKCQPLISNNPGANPYHPLLTPEGAATRLVKAYPYVINNTAIGCPSSAPSSTGCSIQVSGTVSISKGLSYSITDGVSNTVSNTLGQSNTVGTENSNAQEISDTLETSSSFTAENSNSGSTTNSVSDAIGKSTTLTNSHIQASTDSTSDESGTTSDINGQVNWNNENGGSSGTENSNGGSTGTDSSSGGSSGSENTSGGSSGSESGSGTSTGSESGSGTSTSTSNGSSTNHGSESGSGTTNGSENSSGTSSSSESSNGGSSSKEKSWNAGGSFSFLGIGASGGGGGSSTSGTNWGTSDTSGSTTGHDTSSGTSTSHDNTSGSGTTHDNGSGTSTNQDTTSGSSTNQDTTSGTNWGSDTSSGSNWNTGTNSATNWGSSSNQGTNYANSQGGFMGYNHGTSNSITNGHTEEDSNESSAADETSDMLTNTQENTSGWSTSDSTTDGNSKAHTFGSTNTYTSTNTRQDDVSNTTSVANSVDRQLSNDNQYTVDQVITRTLNIGPGIDAVGVYLFDLESTQTQWMCIGDDDNRYVYQAEVSFGIPSADDQNSAILTALSVEDSTEYFSVLNDQLTTAVFVAGGSSTTASGSVGINAISSSTPITLNGDCVGASNNEVILQSEYSQLVLSSFGNLFLQSIPTAGSPAQRPLWQTGTNVQRTVDQFNGNGYCTTGSTLLEINSFGHINLYADKMFTDQKYSPYNQTFTDPTSGRTSKTTYTMIWSTVPKNLRYQVGTRKGGADYVLILEDFKSTGISPSSDLVLYDGGGSVIWCARGIKANCPNGQGFRYPDNWLLPTDYRTDILESNVPDSTNHNNLPIFDLVNKTLLSENQQCDPLLTSGQAIQDSTGRFTLYLNPNGNLIIKDGVRTSWESYTANPWFGHPPYSLNLGYDGSLYLTDSYHKVVFVTTGANRAVNSTMVFEGGRIQIKDSNSTIFDLFGGSTLGIASEPIFRCYSSNCTVCPPVRPKVMTSLWSNGSDYTPYPWAFSQSEKVCSPSGDYCFGFNGSSLTFGGEVLYTGTNQTDLLLGFDLNGRIQLFSQSNSSVALWKNTNSITGTNPYELTVEDSGTIVITDALDNVIWTYTPVPSGLNYQQIYNYVKSTCMYVDDNGNINQHVCQNTPNYYWAIDSKGKYRSQTDPTMCIQFNGLGKQLNLVKCNIAPSISYAIDNAQISNNGYCFDDDIAPIGVQSIVTSYYCQKGNQNQVFGFNVDWLVPGNLTFKPIRWGMQPVYLGANVLGVAGLETNSDDERFALVGGTLRVSFNPAFCLSPISLSVGSQLILTSCEVARFWSRNNNVQTEDNFCIDVYNANTQNPLQIQICNGDANQYFVDYV